MGKIGDFSANNSGIHALDKALGVILVESK